MYYILWPLAPDNTSCYLSNIVSEPRFRVSHVCNFRAASFDWIFLFGLVVRRLLRRFTSAYPRLRALLRCLPTRPWWFPPFSPPDYCYSPPWFRLCLHINLYRLICPLLLPQKPPLAACAPPPSADRSAVAMSRAASVQRRPPLVPSSRSPSRFPLSAPDRFPSLEAMDRFDSQCACGLLYSRWAILCSFPLGHVGLLLLACYFSPMLLAP
jgi:hypothetical protein